MSAERNGKIRKTLLVNNSWLFIIRFLPGVNGLFYFGCSPSKALRCFPKQAPTTWWALGVQWPSA